MSFSLGAVLGAIGGAAGDMGGGILNSAAGYYYSKKMARYNYDLQKKGYKEFPSAQKAGLEAAGINPMVAYGGIGNASFGGGNLQMAHDSKLGSSAVESFREGKKLNPLVDNVKADTDLKNDQGEAALIQAGAAASNAQSQARVSEAQAKLLEAQTTSIGTHTPGETAWGTADRLLSHAGAIGTGVGGTAFAIKTAKDALKNKKEKDLLHEGFKDALKSLKTEGVKGKGEVKVILPSKPANSAKAASTLVPLLIGAGKTGAYIGAGAGALYGTKKLMDAYDKGKSSKKLKDSMHEWSHGHWSR